MSTGRFDKLLDFVRRLNESKITYRMETYRYDAISISLAVPGERWEIDFLDDGSIDVECFRSDGVIHDEAMFEKLFVIYADTPETETVVPPHNGVVVRQRTDPLARIPYNGDEVR